MQKNIRFRDISTKDEKLNCKPISVNKEYLIYRDKTSIDRKQYKTNINYPSNMRKSYADVCAGLKRYNTTTQKSEAISNLIIEHKVCDNVPIPTVQVNNDCMPASQTESCSNVKSGRKKEKKSCDFTSKESDNLLESRQLKNESSKLIDKQTSFADASANVNKNYVPLNTTNEDSQSSEISTSSKGSQDGENSTNIYVSQSSESAFTSNQYSQYSKISCIANPCFHSSKSLSTSNQDSQYSECSFNKNLQFEENSSNQRTQLSDSVSISNPDSKYSESCSTSNQEQSDDANHFLQSSIRISTSDQGYQPKSESSSNSKEDTQSIRNSPNSNQCFQSNVESFNSDQVSQFNESLSTSDQFIQSSDFINFNRGSQFSDISSNSKKNSQNSENSPTSNRCFQSSERFTTNQDSQYGEDSSNQNLLSSESNSSKCFHAKENFPISNQDLQYSESSNDNQCSQVNESSTSIQSNGFTFNRDFQLGESCSNSNEESQKSKSSSTFSFDKILQTSNQDSQHCEGASDQNLQSSESSNLCFQSSESFSTLNQVSQDESSNSNQGLQFNKSISTANQFIQSDVSFSNINRDSQFSENFSNSNEDSQNNKNASTSSQCFQFSEKLSISNQDLEYGERSFNQELQSSESFSTSNQCFQSSGNFPTSNQDLQSRESSSISNDSHNNGLFDHKINLSDIDKNDKKLNELSKNSSVFIDHSCRSRDKNLNLYPEDENDKEKLDKINNFDVKLSSTINTSNIEYNNDKKVVSDIVASRFSDEYVGKHSKDYPENEDLKFSEINATQSINNKNETLNNDSKISTTDTSQNNFDRVHIFNERNGSSSLCCCCSGTATKSMYDDRDKMNKHTSMVSDAVSHITYASYSDIIYGEPHTFYAPEGGKVYLFHSISNIYIFYEDHNKKPHLYILNCKHKHHSYDVFSENIICWNNELRVFDNCCQNQRSEINHTSEILSSENTSKKIEESHVDQVENIEMNKVINLTCESNVTKTSNNINDNEKMDTRNAQLAENLMKNSKDGTIEYQDIDRYTRKDVLKNSNLISDIEGDSVSKVLDQLKISVQDNIQDKIEMLPQEAKELTNIIRSGESNLPSVASGETVNEIIRSKTNSSSDVFSISKQTNTKFSVKMSQNSTGMNIQPDYYLSVKENCNELCYQSTSQHSVTKSLHSPKNLLHDRNINDRSQMENEFTVMPSYSQSDFISKLQNTALNYYGPENYHSSSSVTLPVFSNLGDKSSVLQVSEINSVGKNRNSKSQVLPRDNMISIYTCLSPCASVGSCPSTNFKNIKNDHNLSMESDILNYNEQSLQEKHSDSFPLKNKDIQCPKSSNNFLSYNQNKFINRDVNILNQFPPPLPPSEHPYITKTTSYDTVSKVKILQNPRKISLQQTLQDTERITMIDKTKHHFSLSNNHQSNRLMVGYNDPYTNKNYQNQNYSQQNIKCLERQINGSVASLVESHNLNQHNKMLYIPSHTDSNVKTGYYSNVPTYVNVRAASLKHYPSLPAHVNSRAPSNQYYPYLHS